MRRFEEQTILSINILHKKWRKHLKKKTLKIAKNKAKDKILR